MTRISSSSAARAVSLFAYQATACVSLRQFKSVKNRPSGVGSVKKHWDGSVNLDLAFSAFSFCETHPSFALAFVVLLCATVIGFVSEIRPLNPDSPDYGYDEALGTETSSLSSATFVSSGSCDSASSAGASKDGLDGLGVSAIAARRRGANGQLHAKAIGGNRAE
jgi:hypothetical protein